MTIPPFPSQDLAKLVLGYLAEEQLMTAYDEFLQASPYLDALGNEYDRIFMTSLKSILAEYRAVKIHVETCKPFVLRKKLFQCHNLLDMVKFLIQHVDVTRIQDGNQSKYEADKSSNIGNKCEVCKSLKQEHCSCSKKQLSLSSSQSRNHEVGHSESSVETTPLTDLPGNHVTCRRKNVRVLGAEVSDLNESSDKSTCQTTSINVQTNLCHSDILQNKNSEKAIDSLELNEKEEFNHILKQVSHKNQSETISNIGIRSVDSQRISIEGYNKFATGVTGVENRNINIPDSSTSDNINIQVPAPKEIRSSNMKMAQSRTQYLLKVANVKQPNEAVSINTISACTLPKLKSNAEDGKIKILSDVKVDNPSYNEKIGNLKMPKILKNATSTPLMQMQTIVINGTPVYKQTPVDNTKYYFKHNYTKDEIMAMPTIILAPISGPPPNIADPKVLEGSTAKTQPTLSNTARDLGPLVIDVTSDINKTSNEKSEIVSQTDTKDSKAAKIVDGTSASAPKDNSVASTETNTPQVAPPLRKSCSTPRRTSHVRVLDFTTPRRILHETINKCPPSSTSSDVEIVLSRSPNINYPAAVNKDQIDVTDSSKENSVQIKTSTKRNNWDTDLRALAIINEKDIVAQTGPTPKTKSSKRKRTPRSQSIKKDGKVNKKSESDKKSSTKSTSKSKTSKKVPKPVIEDTQLGNEKVDVTIKPTINIIAGTDRCVPEKPINSIAGTDRCVPETGSSQNKSNNESDTPELERISLQNEIGAKLNISDLLETPYKQVLYDIQMETPRFLGADLNDDPLSAVKILSIPTPKFLNAPTPSSYSSRPTDYSSGGSYYKPDDQDYMRIADDLECPVTISKISESDSIQDKNNETSHKKDKNKEKPSRPVRECTKNVSYFNNKTKCCDDKSIESSSETDINNINDSLNLKELKIHKETKLKSQNRSDRKVPSKIRKTPVKKDASKSFMKIKPRRPTPVKKDVARKKRGTPENSNVKQRKRSIIKETGVTPQVVCAPTKSRRKSSTPRKLHCTKPFNSESSGHDSPELVHRPKENVTEFSVQTTQDSDTEHLPLRWSDDGSQDTKLKEIHSSAVNDIEDINKIQDYIKRVTNKTNNTEGEGSLHIDLVKRGFDLETAKIIERELLDTPPHLKQDVTMTNVVVTTSVEKVNDNTMETKAGDETLDKTLESDCSNNLQIVQDNNEDDEEIELSVHECTEESANYFEFNHIDTKDEPIKEISKLKDKFSMEVCLDDDLSIRLRATTFNLLFDQDPVDDLHFQNQLETEMAVRSISNIDRLYTPIKNSIKEQCYEIFDSTLTSLDTPLKVNTPMRNEQDVTVTEIVLEVEKVDDKDKNDTKKRKRTQCGNLSDDSNESKKAKPEAQYLLNSANIQNIDIESVLSKLHGP